MENVPVNPVSTVKSELKSHRLLWLLPLLFILGYGFGYFTHPSSVKTSTQIQETSQTKENQTQTQQVVQVQQGTQSTSNQQNQNLVTDTSEDIVKNPNGTITIHKETHEHEASQTTQQSQTVAQQSTVATATTKQQETVVTKESETKTKTVTYDKPNWLVTPLVGVGLGFINGKTTFGQSVEYGAVVQHRFIGPVYLGVWGVTNGSLPGSVIGISGTFEF